LPGKEEHWRSQWHADQLASATQPEVLERIAERARRATTIETLAKEICIAEELMAAENHEWVVSLKFRELVLPA
jgi:hypothetical protein